MKSIVRLATVLVVLAAALMAPARVEANDIARFGTFFGTDVAAAGYGGMRGDGTGVISLSGVSGAVTRALLYWHGPSNSTNPQANATVNFAGQPVTGANIGSSDNNCWGFENSQAYRADVTSRVQGNGSYSLGNFVKPGGIDVNGASLIVFFNDGNAANNRDVVVFDGNDSNISNAFDANGWNVTLAGINYQSGSASLDLHVSDGQVANDDALILNGQELAPTGPLFDGNTVPGNAGTPIAGFLWDIRSFDVRSFLTRGPNTLNLVTGQESDCLSLIVALINLPAGAAPPDQTPSAPQPEPELRLDEPALITVVQRPTPNLQSNRASADYGVSSYTGQAINDGIVEYEIEIRNDGRGAARSALITMPFDPAEQRVLDATFSRAGTFVSRVVTNTLEISTGQIAENGDVITGTVRLLTRPTAPLGASLGERLTIRWNDARDGGTGRSNLTVLTVGESDNNQPTYPTSVTPPEGPAGTRHVLGAFIFAPGESVAVWYHTPDNRDVAVGNYTADPEGRLGVEFFSTSLAPGNHFFVAYGIRSRLTAVGPFIVR